MIIPCRNEADVWMELQFNLLLSTIEKNALRKQS
jgi:hypothetical protein